jgi:exodeoxyribonuclease-1
MPHDDPTQTILWHDYETFGINPKVDFPVQFAAIRTTFDLQVIEDQPNINWLCKIPHDYLPHPQACLVTGITPYYSVNKGLSEPEFASRIHKQMMNPNTCVAGYNSMKFDEEVTRHLFFRNLFPVYEREYKNNNSRWDVIDLVRACYALRPENINWPLYDNGNPCFKLEALTKANNIAHEGAHDALSDVRATIAIARLIKTSHPKLYDYYWQLRNKHQVNMMIQQFQSNIFIHVSGFIESDQGCCTIIMPVCAHPENQNSILCIDLLRPITEFQKNEPKTLKELIFDSEIPRENKPGLLNIAVNKCPFVAPIKTLSEERAESLNIDIGKAVENYKVLANSTYLTTLCQSVFSSDETQVVPINIDEQLYTSDFPSSADMRLMETVRYEVPEQLAAYSGKFESELLNKLLFQYRARNYPNLLDEQEMSLWQQHIESRLTKGNKKACLSLNEYFSNIEELSKQYQQYPDKVKILESLKRYANELAGL